MKKGVFDKMELEKKELEQFQTYLRKKGVADNTIIAYRTAVRHQQ